MAIGDLYCADVDVGKERREIGLLLRPSDANCYFLWTRGMLAYTFKASEQKSGPPPCVNTLTAMHLYFWLA